MKLIVLNLFVSICMFFNALGFNSYQNQVITTQPATSQILSTTPTPEVTPAVDPTPAQATLIPTAESPTSLPANTATPIQTESLTPTETATSVLTDTPTPTQVSTTTATSTITPKIDPNIKPNKADFKISFIPVYLLKNKQTTLKYEINPRFESQIGGAELSINLIGDRPKEISRVPVQDLISETKLTIDQGCESGCNLEVDLLTSDGSVIAFDNAEIKIAESFVLQNNTNVFKTQDRKISVKIGAKSLKQNADFYILENSYSDEYPFYPVTRPFEIDAYSAIDGQQIHHFDEPIQIIYSYYDGEFTDPARWNFVSYNEDTGKWEYLPTSVDKENMQIVGYTPHLSPVGLDYNGIDKYKFDNLASAQTNLFTGAATYSYPINVPAGPGGLTPAISISYNSNTVDDASERTQSSWVGMGWDLDVGSITRNTMETDDLEDDTFNLSINGAGGVLIPSAAGTDTNNKSYVDYRTQSDISWRIRRYTIIQGGVSGYGWGDNSYWVIWDKSGNKYTFGADYTPAGKFYYANHIGDDNPTEEIYKWGLSSVQNIFGQTITYSYIKNISRQVPDIAQGPTQWAWPKNGLPYYYGWSDVALYLDTVTYGNYQIVFQRDHRLDYDASCQGTDGDVFIHCSIDFYRLDRIVVKATSNGNGNYDITIRTYRLGFVNNSGMVFPDISWHTPDGLTGRTLTLTSVQELGKNSGALSYTSFGYEDGMHLTSVNNGYNGKVNFIYENDGNDYVSMPWPYLNSDVQPSAFIFKDGEGDGNVINPYNTNPLAYVKSGDGFNANPGGTYRFEVQAKNCANTQFWFLFSGYFAGQHLLIGTPHITAFNDNSPHIYFSNMQIPIGIDSPASNQHRAFQVQGSSNQHCEITHFFVGRLVTRYRVIEKRIYTNASSTDYQSITYLYNNPAVNDFAHSGMANQSDFTKDTVIHKPNSEFKGHQSVLEFSPDHFTVTTFNQIGETAGRVEDVKTYTGDGQNTLLAETINSYLTPTDISTLAYSNNGNDFDDPPLCPPTGTTACKDAKIFWTDISSSETRIYSTVDSSYISKMTEYVYDPTLQGGTQYGNVTNIIESSGSSSSSMVRYRATRTRYYPFPDAAHFLVGLPAYTNRYVCPSGTCGYQAADILGSHIYLYDGQNYNYGTPPVAGILTGERQFLRFAGANYTDNRYLDIRFTYDAWGNRNASTQYSNEGLFTSPATTVAQPVSTNFDTVFHTFPAYQTNAKGQSTYWIDPAHGCDYDYGLGVPLCEIDANGAKTTATYDQFGRLLTIRRPGDEGGPTLQATYHDTQGSYYWTEAQQKIDASTVSTVRKFYNGLNELIQTQQVGAVSSDCASLPGSPTNCTIVVDQKVEYDSTTHVKTLKQSVPYVIINRDGYFAPSDPWTQPYTTTTYDDLGRTAMVKSPWQTDATSQRFSYALDSSQCSTNGALYLKITSTDPNGNQTQTCQDVWGRTTKEIPATGPGVGYVYDASDNLLQTTYGTAVTNMTYDSVGRKWSMTDPDMGNWTYVYDALNLTSQTDARGCTTTLIYDTLNRVTNKSYSGCPSSVTTTPPETYTYDAGTNGVGHRTGMYVGNLTDNNKSSWNYDTRGRVHSETKTFPGQSALTTNWTYNSADQVSTMTYPDGEMVTSTYLPQMALNSLTTSLTDNPVYVQSSTYDAAGRLDVQTFGNNLLKTNYDYYGWADTAFISTGEDSVGQGGRLRYIKTGTPSSPTSLQDLEYRYDENGNIRLLYDGKTGSGGNPEQDSFGYDGSNRLQSAASSYNLVAPYSQSYSYDTNGNLSSKPVSNSNAGYFYSIHNLNTPAHAVKRLGVTGTGSTNTTITIRAKGTSAAGVWPQMQLWVNGELRQEWTVNQINYTDYTLVTPLTGKDEIEVVFTNDGGGGGEDRNLFVDYVQVGTQVYQTESGLMVIDRGADSASFDWVDVIKGQEAVAWNAALRFVVGAGAQALGYDANGNLAWRLEVDKVTKYVYDAENHLTAVYQNFNTSPVTTYGYDADGQRISSSNSYSYTYFLGNYYEILVDMSGGGTTKYYYAGARRIAMRQGDVLYYLYSDHLGSISVSYQVNNGAITRQQYFPWGEVRPGPANGLYTDYTFTGQKTDSYINLMWYGSRWYDNELGRFIQPDPIVPSVGEGGNPNSVGYLANANYSALVVSYAENQLLAQVNSENQRRLLGANAVFSFVPTDPQAFDRYAYCLNNPVGYNDPTGHFAFLAALAFIPVYGWLALGVLAVGTIVYYEMGGPQALADAIAPSIPTSSISAFSGNAGGASQAAQHLAMLLGGQAVAGFAPHPGMPDPDGRDRKHNAEGLRNTLRDIQHNMRNGENINDFLTRQGWSEGQIQEFNSAVNDYVKGVLPTDVEYYGVSQDLADELINLAGKIGIQ